MEEQKRMTSNEQKGYIDLLGIISKMAFLEDNLGKRIRAVDRGNFRYKGAMTNLVRLANDILHTAPMEQREHIRRQLPSIMMIVGTTAQLPRNYDAEYGRWLSFNDLDIVAEAIRECCRTCTLEDPQQQKQCQYKKLLDVLPTDKPDESARGCGYFTIW